MLYIPVSAIQGKITRSEHLTAGMNLMQVLKDEAIVPNGVMPIIAGGAVRDVFCHEAIPHDVDIFFISHGVNTRSTQTTRLMHENLILWLDDNDIEYRSLVDEQVAQHYGAENRMLEILEFRYQNVTVQVMVPENLRGGFDGFSSHFPTYSQCFLSSDALSFTDSGFAAQFAPHRPALNEGDIQYLMHKFPNDRWVPYASKAALLECAMATVPEILESYNGYSNEQRLLPNVNSVFGMNHARLRLIRFAATKLGINARYIFDNSSHITWNYNNYRADRISTVVPPQGTAPIPPSAQAARSFFANAVPSGRFVS